MTAHLKFLALACLVGHSAGCQETAETPDVRHFTSDTRNQSCVDPTNNWEKQDLGDAVASDQAEQRTNLFAVWGESDRAVFAVGSEGRVVFWDGKTWKAQTTPTTQTLTSVWGTNARDVWAVGFGGTVIHFDGTTWQDRSPPIDVFWAGENDGAPPKGDAALPIRRNLWGVWAAGTTTTDALYAVGDRGLVLSFQKSIWYKVPSGVEDNLNGVWGKGSGKFYVAGDFGTILVGSPSGTSATFAKANTGITKALRHVWGRSDGDVYAVGLTGTILHSSGGNWDQIKGAPKQYLRSIWGPDDDPSVNYIVGWDGTLLRMTSGGSGTATFDLFKCVTSDRLESIWGTMVAGTASDGAKPKDGSTGAAQVPAIWVAGVSGGVLTGP